MEVKNIGFENPNDFIEKLAQIGLSNHASDIHITPGINTTLIKFRIGGELKSIYTFSNDLYSKFINAMKVKSGMDISEHNHIQDGKIFLQINLNGKNVGVNMRVASLPTLHGENIVMRLLLAESEYLDINTLGYSKSNTLLLRDVSNLSEGLVLVSGGTGSGKTTTLYSILNTFDKTKKGIFTLEDPVEYQVDGYVQSQIRNLKGSGDASKSYTFEEGLIGILRQDPDVIMIGELRREEEAKTCFEAANTGHVVLGTIHSNNAVSVITRVRQFGIESYLIASGLKYIVSQKINKTLCSSCRIKEILNKIDLPVKFQKFINGETVTIYKSNIQGCSKCTNGYAGITLIGEVIKVDDKLYELLLDNKGETEIKEYLFKNGFIPYYIDAFQKSIQGKIDIKDVLELEY